MKNIGKNIWNGVGKCINFATAKEETGHAPGNFCQVH